MNSLVSVIVPSYNYEKYIIECIRSIENQDYKEIELIIIDDFSNDNSPLLISEYLDSDKIKNRFLNIIFKIHEKNMGAHYTINEAISYAKGKYISIINADDMYMSNRFSTIIPLMERKGCPFAFSSVEIIGTNSCVEQTEEAESFRNVQGCIDENVIISHELISQNVAISTGNFVFEISLYEKLGGFRQYKYIHDWDFILRACLICEPLYTNGTQYLYRLHESNSFRELDNIATFETNKVLGGLFRKILLGKSDNRNLTAKILLQFLKSKPYFKTYIKYACLPWLV